MDAVNQLLIIDIAMAIHVIHYATNGKLPTGLSADCMTTQHFNTVSLKKKSLPNIE